MSDIDVEPVDDVDEATDGDAAPPPDDDAGEARIDADAPDATESDPDEDLVEADRLEPLPEDAPEFVLYGGKGGVGKTTMAAATGLASAIDDTRTLVVSTDPAHSLSDTYNADIGAEPTRISEQVPLYAAEIDPDAAMEQGMGVFGGAMGGGAADGGAQSGDQFGGGAAGAAGGPDGGPFGGGDGPMGGLGAIAGGGNPMEAMLGGTMPGSDEAVAMQQLVEFMDDDRFDRVVVDTAPTGHTLRLLELPELMDSMVGRLLSIRERMSGLFEGLTGMFGEDVDPEDADQGVDDLRELSDRIERLRDTLQDPALTDFRIVMVPEELSVIESERLLRQLDDFSIPVETVVVNKVMEDLADVTDAVEGDVVTPNLDDCEFCQRRWDVQQLALSRAQEVFRGRSIKRVPLLADEVRGERPLRVVAACLE